MFDKIRRVIQENRNYHKDNLLLLKELEWAHVYHDSIRGKEWLEKLPLNVGRWSGNYAFFYVLNRVLTDFKPKTILEFGLGESSKFISVFLENYLFESAHLIIEHDQNWYTQLKQNFQLSERSKVEVCNLISKKVKSFDVYCYENLPQKILQKFDLYVVDGPIGSAHYSRFDIVKLAETFLENDQFIIVIDDYNRQGEQETVQELMKAFKEKNLNIYKGVYIGNKSVCILGTEKYKNIQSF